LKNFTQEEIVRGCKKQDPRYQKALVVQYSGLLMAISRRYTRDQYAAKDILQESLIQILKSIPNYKEQGTFEAWMKRIVINTAIKFFDKGSFKNELYTIDDQPTKAIPSEAYTNLAAKELWALIERLPENYRTVFNLHAIEGYSHKEISVMLEIKESTSRSHLTRARSMLRKILSNNKQLRIRI